MRFLLIDDDPAVLRLACYALERDGVQVAAFHDPREGIAAAAREPFDAVLLDVVMPELGGPEVLGALRSAAGQSLPIIFLSAKNRPAEIDDLLRLGAAGVIPKPFDPARLPAEIRAILGRGSADAPPTPIPASMRRELALATAERLDEIERAVAVLEQEPSDIEHLRRVMSAFHRVAGAWASEAARDAEQQAEELLDAGSPPAPAVLRQWRDAAHQIRDALEAPPVDRRVTRILCISGDSEAKAALAPLALDGNCVLEFAATAAEGKARLDERVPEVLIVSADLPDGRGLDVAEHARARAHGGRAALFMSLSRPPLSAEIRRAAAVFADGFIDMRNADDALERIRIAVDRKFGPPPRVLCAALDGLAEAFTSVMESAGYQVRVIDGCAHIEVDLARFDPDAVVAGLDADPAETLRMMRTVHLLTRPACPVILIGSAVTADLLLDANRAGAADVLHVPLSRALLLTTLEKRVAAARAAKLAARTDPHTGCLREMFFRERLQQRLNEKMFNRRSTLVLVETDQSLVCQVAGLLRRRLRETDEIGRLGTRSLAVLMERIDEAHATALFARLREELAMSFRAAVAVEEEERDADEWLERASRLLRLEPATSRIAPPEHALPGARTAPL